MISESFFCWCAFGGSFVGIPKIQVIDERTQINNSVVEVHPKLLATAQYYSFYSTEVQNQNKINHRVKNKCCYNVPVVVYVKSTVIVVEFRSGLIPASYFFLFLFVFSQPGKMNRINHAY